MRTKKLIYSADKYKTLGEGIEYEMLPTADEGSLDQLDDFAEQPSILDSGLSYYNSRANSLDFENVNKDYGVFIRKHLSFINFITSSFRFANFDKSNLVGANFSSSDAHGASFRHAEFEFSEIHHCDFSEADFTGAKLQGSSIVNCDFSWSNIRGANLEDCQIRDTDFTGAIFDNYTRLPFSEAKALSMGMSRVGRSRYRELALAGS